MKKQLAKKNFTLTTETVRVLRDNQIALADGGLMNNTFMCPATLICTPHCLGTY